MLLSSLGEELADPMNAFPALFTAAIAKPFDRFKNWFRFVPDEVVIYVDYQHGRSLSEAGLFAVTGKSENIFIAWR
jgi:hypothetical protein